jgi:hypothetical protein
MQNVNDLAGLPFYSFQTKYTDAFAGKKRGFKEFLRNKLSLTTG